MKFVSKAKRSEITDVLTFDDPFFSGWELTVRAMSRVREEELSDRATIGGKQDENALYMLYAEECVIGWKGCKLDHIEALVGEFGEDLEALLAQCDIQPDRVRAAADGTVAYSAEICAFVMRAARRALFELPILQMSRSLARVAAEKKRRPGPSSGD